MQEVYNPEWYASNNARAYPLVDSATHTDDQGNRLPHSIVTDIKLSFLVTKDDVPRCYISGVTITQHLVTVILSKANGTLLGAISLEQPVQFGKYYSIEPLAHGVGGSIAFGMDANKHFGTWRFSSLEQSEILQSCVLPYRQPSVSGIKTPGAANYLTGDVLLKAGTDIVITKEEVKTDEGIKQAFVFELDLLNSDTNEMLKKYLGVNDKRPESDTCPRPSVLTINNVEPDCAGNINIETRGNIQLVQQCEEGIHAITITSDINLEDVCDNTMKDPPPDTEDNCFGEIDCEPKLSQHPGPWTIADLATDFTILQGIGCYYPKDSRLGNCAEATEFLVAYLNRSSDDYEEVEAHFEGIGSKTGYCGITYKHQETDQLQYKEFKVRGDDPRMTHYNSVWIRMYRVGETICCFVKRDGGESQEWLIVNGDSGAMTDIGLILNHAYCKCYMYVPREKTDDE